MLQVRLITIRTHRPNHLLGSIHPPPAIGRDQPCLTMDRSDACLPFRVRSGSNLPAFIAPRGLRRRFDPSRTVAAKISDLVVARSVRRIAEQRAQARPEPCGNLRWHFQVLIRFLSQPTQRIGVNEPRARRAASVRTAAMPSRAHVKKR